MPGASTSPALAARPPTGAKPEARLEAMSMASLPEVLAIEKTAYSHPWSIENFSDSLRTGYGMQQLRGGPEPDASLIGYFVAMQGVDEMHLLNITVAPAYQGQGWGRVLLDALALWSCGVGAQCLWLEVRASNTHARDVYLHTGFQVVGMRARYYPVDALQREDAIVMRRSL